MQLLSLLMYSDHSDSKESKEKDSLQNMKKGTISKTIPPKALHQLPQSPEWFSESERRTGKSHSGFIPAGAGRIGFWFASRFAGKTNTNARRIANVPDQTAASRIKKFRKEFRQPPSTCFTDIGMLDQISG